MKARIQGKSEKAKVTGAAHCMNLEERSDLSEIAQLTSFSLVREKQERSRVEQLCLGGRPSVYTV